MQGRPCSCILIILYVMMLVGGQQRGAPRQPFQEGDPSRQQRRRWMHQQEGQEGVEGGQSGALSVLWSFKA